MLDLDSYHWVCLSVSSSLNRNFGISAAVQQSYVSVNHAHLVIVIICFYFQWQKGYINSRSFTRWYISVRNRLLHRRTNWIVIFLVHMQGDLCLSICQPFCRHLVFFWLDVYWTTLHIQDKQFHIAICVTSFTQLFVQPSANPSIVYLTVTPRFLVRLLLANC